MQNPFSIIIYALAFVWIVGCTADPVQPPNPAPEPIASEPTAPQSESQREPEPTYVIEPEAIKALDDMGGYLRSLKAFRVHSENSRDEILDYGQKIMVDNQSVMTVQGDDHLHIANKNAFKDIDQQFFFNGQTFTIYGNKNKFYASFEAPGSIRQLLDEAWNQFGIEIPLADLFRWGKDKDVEADILAATYLGPDEVNGKSCNHYAYRNKDVDWQLWIENDATPLPLKLVITNTLDPTLPQFISMMKWELNPRIKSNIFTYVPTKDAQKIEFAVIETTAESDGEAKYEAK
ncbi:DUF2092 domain-containing protein [Methylomonas sp. MgM2]